MIRRAIMTMGKVAGGIMATSPAETAGAAGFAAPGDPYSPALSTLGK
jgi:hypothetical protein